MKANGRVNRIRRKLMHLLTGNLGRDKCKHDRLDRRKIERVLICRPNGRLGNQLLITPLVQEVGSLFPNSRTDLFVKGGAAAALFCNYGNVDRIIKLPGKPFKQLLPYIGTWLKLLGRRYDIAINVIPDSSSGRLSAMLSRAGCKFYNDPVEELRDKYGDYSHMAKFPVYNLRHSLRRFGVDTPEGKPVPVLDIRLSPEERERGKDILRGITHNDKETICIYTFATGDKLYSESWWRELYGRLKDGYGGRYNIVEVLPSENLSQIGFAAPSYYSMDLREIAGVLSNAAAFVLADCGIMHLGAAAHVPVTGLFSVTSADRYGPYGPGCTAIDTTRAAMEEITGSIDAALKAGRA